MWNFSWKNICFMLLGSNPQRVWGLRNNENLVLNICLNNSPQCHHASWQNEAFWIAGGWKGECALHSGFLGFALWRRTVLRIRASIGVPGSGWGGSGGDGRKQISFLPVLLLFANSSQTMCPFVACPWGPWYGLHSRESEGSRGGAGWEASLSVPLTFRAQSNFHEADFISFHTMDLTS